MTRLGGAKGCEAAIKSQLTEVDSLEVTVEVGDVATGGKSASARVKSIHEGKKRPQHARARQGRREVEDLGRRPERRLDRAPLDLLSSMSVEQLARR